MKIGLIDVDGHNFPNLALMKISAYHKNLGDHVEFVSLFRQYDIVYKSKVFTFTPDFNYIPHTEKLIKGGTGYNLESRLPDEIENQYPDYDLYKIKNVAYGYLTRGCPRKCDFCIVADKEGAKSYKVADLNSFWNGQKEIKLLDPNLLACKNHTDLLNQLIESNAYVDFTQGLDARLLNPHIIKKINKLKIKMIHFAWDNERDSDLILRKLELFNQSNTLNYRKKRVYILTNFNTNFEFDLYRVETLKKIGYDPYVMIYEKETAPKNIRRLQRYVNSKYIFNSCKSFSEYLKIEKSKVIENQVKMEV
jgi:hypothetical protein